MIRSVKGAATRQFMERGKSKFSGLDEGLARRRLTALNVARKLDDISRLRSVGLDKLTGDRAGHWAIRVNGPWRIVSHALALKLRVPANRLTEILNGKRGISPDTALRLSRFLGPSAAFWLHLQSQYDLARAEKLFVAKIKAEVEPA